MTYVLVNGTTWFQKWTLLITSWSRFIIALVETG
jgi:hypothetical protein